MKQYEEFDFDISQGVVKLEIIFRKCAHFKENFFFPIIFRTGLMLILLFCSSQPHMCAFIAQNISIPNYNIADLNMR